MKKLMTGLCALVACSSLVLSAQEAASTAASTAPAATPLTKAPPEKASWPVWLAFNSTPNIDIVGLHLTIPYGSCESVTGFELGFFGRCRYMDGLQLNILRNDVIDNAAGAQVGIYNSIGGRADIIGVQVGLWNEARYFRGVQAGLINIADSGQGFQFGIINRTEAFYGYQIGLINVIRSSDVPFLPFINIGF